MSTSTKPIAFYYGDGKLEQLAQYERVVLQPGFYSASQVAWLEAQGTFPLAYLSLTEDTGPAADWQYPKRNPDWGGAYVQVSHPGWISQVLEQAQAALDKGFMGLFLDTLDIAEVIPQEGPHVLQLLAQLRQATRPAYLMANRGFPLLPGLTEYVDGHLFESFSVAWTRSGADQAWSADILQAHDQLARDLQQTNLELFALDYADTPELEAFARQRAQQFGMKHFISDKALSKV